MCLCLFAIDQHDEYPFILIANRDEFRNRPSAQASFWEDHPNVLAGRDLEAMGTWLGINKGGEIAFLTNYRHPDYFDRKGPSRGNLVSDFLTSDIDAESYLRSIENPKAYNGFNLVVGKPSTLFYFANANERMEKIESGVHGLSNAFLNTSWPKVDDGKAKLKAAINADKLDNEELFTILGDDHTAKLEELPNTGVGTEIERVLSPKFINTKEYGTVCSTVVKMSRNGAFFFEERRFDDLGNENGKVSFQVTID